MRTLYSFATVCVFGAAFSLLPACGSTTDEPTPATGGSASGGAASGGASGGGASNGDPAKGATIYSTNCVSCHGSDAAGKEGPNITMSMTAGIGSWTYQQFSDAVHTGKDKDGTQLCPLMTMFPEIVDPGLKDLYAFIKSKPISDVVNKGTYCGNN